MVQATFIAKRCMVTLSFLASSRASSSRASYVTVSHQLVVCIFSRKHYRLKCVLDFWGGKRLNVHVV